MKAVVGLVDAVAQDQPVVVQLVSDRENCGAHALIVGRQEADQRDQQGRGIERNRVVVLDEHATLIDTPCEDLGAHLLGSALPALREIRLAAELCQTRTAVERDPAHQLRGDVVLRSAACLPDPLVGLAPDPPRRLDLVAKHRPQAIRDVVVALGVQVDGVEHRAIDVVLTLVVGAIALADRARALVALELAQRGLAQIPLAANPVHDLQRAILVARQVGDVLHEVVRFPVEAERVQAPECERRVAHPAVAVVPVALATWRLR